MEGDQIKENIQCEILNFDLAIYSITDVLLQCKSKPQVNAIHTQRFNKVLWQSKINPRILLVVQITPPRTFL